MDGSIAVMQPYFFPYIGYFQLIKEVDTFIFYDDVNYIKGGWINRNKILINNKAKYITVPCKEASPNKFIYEIEHGLNEKNRKKLIKKVKFSYANAPFFDDVFQIFQRVIYSDESTIANLAIRSIDECCKYLGLETTFKKSRNRYGNKEMDAADRLIDICRVEEAYTYINPVGGKELYDKEYFKEFGVKLFFLEPENVSYKQFNEDHIPWLSIIDVMMFNSPQDIRNEFLESYRLS